MGEVAKLGDIRALCAVLGQQGGNAVAEKRVDLAYDAASRWDTLTRYADLAGMDLVAESSWIYDNASRLTDLAHTKGANTLAGYSWTYDSSGGVTQFDSVTDGTVDYTYDDANQLTGADYDYQTDESYSYDANGNRTNIGYSTGDDNRLLSDGTYTYLYDAEGNRTARFVDVNTNGVLDTGDTDITEYTWDYRNRLTNVTERATYSGAAAKATDLAYDYLNRLVSESADADGAGEGEADDTYYVYEGSQIALQFNGSESSDLSHRYLWGTAVDQVLADEQVTSLETAGDILWPLTDNLGTVRDLATYDSQQDETTIANHRTYDAYGQVTSETNSAIDHLFAFTGRHYDESTALQNNLNRWYDPQTGRWLSQDPVGIAGGVNLYAYVFNSATNHTDPSGLFVWPWDPNAQWWFGLPNPFAPNPNLLKQIAIGLQQDYQMPPPVMKVPYYKPMPKMPWEYEPTTTIKPINPWIENPIDQALWQSKMEYAYKQPTKLDPLPPGAYGVSKQIDKTYTPGPPPTVVVPTYGPPPYNVTPPNCPGGGVY